MPAPDKRTFRIRVMYKVTDQAGAYVNYGEDYVDVSLEAGNYSEVQKKLKRVFERLLKEE
jgi:hypothetical protein